MATSDAGAHRVLDASVQQDMWLGIALSIGGDLTGVVEADEAYLSTPRALIPGGSGWAAASGRQVMALAATAHGDALVDFTPAFWVLWSDESGGSPLFARRITDTSVRAGDGVTVPASTIQLIYP